LDGGSARRTGQHNTEKRGHISMPRSGFEPIIPVFERWKTVRALDSATTGTSENLIAKVLVSKMITFHYSDMSSSLSNQILKVFRGSKLCRYQHAASERPSQGISCMEVSFCCCSSYKAPAHGGLKHHSNLPTSSAAFDSDPINRIPSESDSYTTLHESHSHKTRNSRLGSF